MSCCAAWRHEDDGEEEFKARKTGKIPEERENRSAGEEDRDQAKGSRRRRGAEGEEISEETSRCRSDAGRREGCGAEEAGAQRCSGASPSQSGPGGSATGRSRQGGAGQGSCAETSANVRYRPARSEWSRDP